MSIPGVAMKATTALVWAMTLPVALGAAQETPPPTPPVKPVQTQVPPAAPGAPGPPVQPPAMSIVSPAIVSFDAAQQGGQVVIRLLSTTARELMLDAGPLIDRQTKEAIPAQIDLQPRELKLLANVPQPVTVKVSGVLLDGTADFEIGAGAVRIGAVTVVRGPFAVAVAETTAIFQKGRTTALTVRNDARYPYNVHWMAHIGPHRYCGEKRTTCADNASDWTTVTVPPKDSQTIHIRPPDQWFDRSVTERPMKLSLLLAPGAGLPRRLQTLDATLVGPFVQWQWLFVLAMLLLGALFSLLVRYWVPNTQRKRELKEQASRVRSKIDAFSDDIDYELRAQTRVQGHLLESLRRSAWTVMPHYESVAAQCAAGLGMLEKRVDLIEEIDSVYAIERAKWQSCPPPSQIDRAEETLRGALEALKKPSLSEAEFIAVKAEVDRARTLSARMGAESAEFGQELAARLETMSEELQAYRGTAAYAELESALPGLFRTVAPQANANGVPAEIPPLRYSLLDYNLTALQIARDYIWLASGAAATQKLTTDVKDALVQHLSRQSWTELRLARLLLKQFRENSYEDQVWQAIEAGDAGIYVVHEPTDLRSMKLVQFRIYFRRSELNWAGARDLVAPEWEFSDGSKPRGWTISHFFTDTRTSPSRWEERWKLWRAGESPHWKEKVTINFEARPTADGTPRRRKAAIELQLSVRDGRADDPRSRTASEALGLMVSIAIPLISLMATAKEQLAQNPAGGALMIFLLGFSSDTLISTFKQRATRTS